MYIPRADGEYQYIGIRRIRAMGRSSRSRSNISILAGGSPTIAWLSRAARSILHGVGVGKAIEEREKERLPTLEEF